MYNQLVISKPSKKVKIVFLKQEKLQELWNLESEIIIDEYTGKIDYEQEGKFLLKTNRPYVGPIINIDGWDFYAPITTNKQNKIFDREHIAIFSYSNNHLIKFNNMIPFMEKNISYIPTNSKDLRNLDLYLKEQNESVFYKKAKLTYHNKKYNSSYEFEKVAKTSLNFEKVIKIYSQHLKLQQDDHPKQVNKIKKIPKM